MNARPTEDPAVVLSRIGRALGVSPTAPPWMIEAAVDSWMRTLVRIGRAVKAEKLTDPASVAAAAEALTVPVAASVEAASVARVLVALERLVLECSMAGDEIDRERLELLKLTERTG